MVAILIVVLAAGLLVMAVNRVRQEADRMSCQNNMKQLGLALMNYYDTYNCFPPGTVPSDNQGATNP
jgi:hypothetical protein